MDDRASTGLDRNRPSAVVGFDGVIRSTNDSWRAFFAERGARSLSEVLYRLIHPADRTTFLSCWETLAPVDAITRCEVRAIDEATDLEPRDWVIRTRRGYDNVVVTIGGADDDEGTHEDDAFPEFFSAGSVASDSAFRDAILSTMSAVGNGITVAEGNDIIWANQALCDMFGYEARELVGTTGMQLVAEHDRKRVWSLRERRQSGEAVTPYYEIDGLKKSGETFRVEIAVESIRLEGTDHYVLTCRDVSERAQRQEAEARVRRLESMARVAGAIGREYNDVTMAFELLGDALRNQASDESSTLLRQFDRATRRAIILTRRLITLEDQPLSRAQFVDLNVVVWEACSEIEDHLSVRIETRLTPGVPVVRLDRDLVYLVLHELLDNAANASRQDARVLVETSFLTVTEDDQLGPLLHEGTYAVIRVIDDGEGIPPEAMEHLFEPFFTTRPSVSSGLGLSTVRGVMRQLGGHVEIDSNMISGTRVGLFIPVGSAKPDVKRPRRKVVPADVDVLLIDSSEMVRELLKTGLERVGYRVHSAPNREKALGFIDAGTDVDIVVMEPLGDYDKTVEFVRRVRADDAGRSIVLTLGGATVAHGDLSNVLPNLSFLHKPFGVDRLDREIRLSLGSKSTIA